METPPSLALTDSPRSPSATQLCPISPNGFPYALFHMRADHRPAPFADDTCTCQVYARAAAPAYPKIYRAFFARRRRYNPGSTRAPTCPLARSTCVRQTEPQTLICFYPLHKYSGHVAPPTVALPAVRSAELGHAAMYCLHTSRFASKWGGVDVYRMSRTRVGVRGARGVQVLVSAYGDGLVQEDAGDISAKGRERRRARSGMGTPRRRYLVAGGEGWPGIGRASGGNGSAGVRQAAAIARRLSAVDGLSARACACQPPTDPPAVTTFPLDDVQPSRETRPLTAT
ncbi:hypothetical protein C8R44DRAFT_891853 [Mycena epipterygia]|nr:hypothetical protein C8R44DRAFT_891853 [Mycena epipterygia]